MNMLNPTKYPSVLREESTSPANNLRGIFPPKLRRSARKTLRTTPPTKPYRRTPSPLRHTQVLSLTPPHTPTPTPPHSSSPSPTPFEIIGNSSSNNNANANNLLNKKKRTAKQKRP